MDRGSGRSEKNMRVFICAGDRMTPSTSHQVKD
jgi:hypothetical protein